MQDVTLSPIKSIAFVVLCGSDKSRKSLEFCLERLNKLNKEGTDIKDIYVYLVSNTEASNYIRHKSFKDYTKTLENLTVKNVLGSTNYATEPRAYNYGLDEALDSPADFFVFLHETDIVSDIKLLDYYMWLFNTAHNPDVVGAVALSSSAAKSKVPDKVKMWYGDDIYLRGVCIKREAIISTGGFDEAILYRYFEWDFFNRMVHHNGWLTRIGKEKNNFIKFGPEDLTPDFVKISFIRKQSMVWFARKWHYKGVWPEANETCNCFLRYNTFYQDNKSVGHFTSKFSLTEEQKEATLSRFETIYQDTAIKNAVSMSESFTKKPIGQFVIARSFEGGPLFKNNRDIQTHIRCQIQYWEDMLWDVKGVY